MYKRGGSYLENNVASLFQRAGFRTQINTWISGYEIDVLASKGEYKIAIECKQYERSHISIRNILHQWASKNTIVKADKIVLVIAGQIPTSEDYFLANNLAITLIGDDKMHRLNGMNDVEKLKEELNEMIKFDLELYKEKQKKKLIRTGFIVLFTGLALILISNALKDVNFTFFFIFAFMVAIVLLLRVVKPRRRHRRRRYRW